MIHCPLNLNLLLHAYTTSSPVPNQDAPAVQSGLRYLHQHGMIDRIDFPRATEKGEAFIKHLMEIPFPVQKWEISDAHQNSNHDRNGG